MKIGLNATCYDDRPSGAKQRFKLIYEEFFKLRHRDEFVVYQPSDCDLSLWFSKHDNVRFEHTPLSSRNRLQKYLMGRRYWPRILASENFDLFECFHLPFVNAPDARTILTIHDIHGVSASLFSQLLYKMILGKAIGSADRIIAVSQTVKDEIQALYPDAKISVVYNGIEMNGFTEVSNDKLKKTQENLNLPQSFLLSVGHFEKRKNYLALINALACLHKRGNRLNLVIVGNDSGSLKAVVTLIRRLGLSQHVRICSNVSDSDLHNIYQLCSLFVFPSSYEGFGIPILEAMAAEKPYVLSDIPVFKEITQRQTAYFPRANPEVMADVIESTLSSNTECDRIIAYGKQRVMDFTPKKICHDLQDIYHSLQK